jgi:hypothetical protein
MISEKEMNTELEGQVEPGAARAARRGICLPETDRLTSTGGAVPGAISSLGHKGAAAVLGRLSGERPGTAGRHHFCGCQVHVW